MLRFSTKKNKGFTLLEILLVVAIIAILAGIVIVAINPAKQLGNTRDSQRKSDIATLYKAINQYLIDKGSLPTAITTGLSPICRQGGGSSCIDLTLLTPTYLSEIPKDPLAPSGNTAYYIQKVDNNVYIEAQGTEIGYVSQPGYSSTTPVIAFIGKMPNGHVPGSIGTGAVSSNSNSSSGCVATGGTVSTITGYTIHTFTSSGTFTVTSGSCNAQVLVVAGGGGGGTWVGAGGGGGGVVENNSYALTAQSYSVTVGQGAPRASANGTGANGDNSVFGSITAIGGGGGGAYPPMDGSSGGSGGGAVRAATPGSGTAGQGYDGGFGTGLISAGGGGAGGVGGNAVGDLGGVGGPGKSSSITGSTVYYGGGGGGWSFGYTATGALGGSGGGGRGSSGDNNGIPDGIQAGDGSPNTGGGGGGGWYHDYGYEGGGGGSGIVIIRYSS